MKTKLQEYMEALLKSNYLETCCRDASNQTSSAEQGSRLKKWFGCFGIHSNKEIDSEEVESLPPLALEHIKSVCEKIRDQGIDHLTTDDYLYFIAYQGMISEFNTHLFLASAQYEVSNEIKRRLRDPSPVSSASTL